MKETEFREIKSEIRLIGIDDGSFDAETDDETCLVGVVFRGGKWIDGVMVDNVELDGTDSTSRIIDMINDSRHKEQLRVILTSGITFGGFNVLDVEELYEETGLPVIVVTREKPDMDAVREALKNLPNWKDRWEKIESMGTPVPVQMEKGDVRRSDTIYIQTKGITKKDAKELVRMSSTRSSIPEPLRIAHLIATAIARGESVGRV